jgi:phosphoglucosamine mutase
VRAKVGDRYILEELLARGWQLGGENSGHLLVLDRHTTGDGIVSALQVLQAIRRTGKTLPALLDGVQLFPQVMINVRLAVRTDWQQNATLVAEKARVEQELGSDGRVLIRASGTEPVLRVMVETPDRTRAQAFAHRLAEAARVS